MGLNLNPNGDQSNPLQLTHGDNTIVGLFDTGTVDKYTCFR